MLSEFFCKCYRPIEKFLSKTHWRRLLRDKIWTIYYGSVSVNGSRSQNCPNDPNFDTDGIALQILRLNWRGQLTKDNDCTETKM